MISLLHIEKRIRELFSNEIENKPLTFVSRLRKWYRQTFGSETYHHFTCTNKQSIDHDLAMLFLHKIFPGYDLYVGSASSYDLCQDTWECAMNAGNTMFWFTVGNEQVELELKFLITPDRRVDVELFQRTLRPIRYAEPTHSSAA